MEIRQFDELKNSTLREFFQNIWFVLSIAWNERKTMFLWLSIVRLLGALIPATQVYIGKLIVDRLISAVKEEDNLPIALFVLLGAEIALLVISRILASAQKIAEEALRWSFQLGVDRRVAEHASALDISYFEDTKFHDKLRHVREKTVGRTSAVLNSIFTLGGELISIIALGAVFVRLGWIFVALLFVTVIPAIFVDIKIAAKSYDWEKKWRREWRHVGYYGYLLTMHRYVQEMRVYRLPKLFLERLHVFTKRFLKEDFLWEFHLAKARFTKNVISDMGYYIGLFIAAMKAVEGVLTVGDVTMFISGYRRTQGGLLSIISSIADLYENHLFIRDLIDFLGYQPRIVVSQDAYVIGKNDLIEIGFNEVSFHYGDEQNPVLRNVSFVIPATAKVGLVGENGSGKTTLTKLLLRFYDPSMGHILINGRDLREINLESYYNRIGAIFQEYPDYTARIKEQIGLGHIERMHDFDAIAKAARTADADSFIEKLPKRYETPLGHWKLEDDTHELSGGQWQRLAIARAFMKNDAGLFILDEPNASLDPDTEERIFEKNFKQMNGKATVLFISQRFSTIRQADLVVVLKEGSVAETGTHASLISRSNGVYADLFKKQAQYYR